MALSPGRSQRSALTLLELVLLLVIATALFGLVVAGVQKVKSSAEKSDCQNRLRTLTSAIFRYESREGRLPPGSISGPFAPRKVPDEVDHSLWATLLTELDHPTPAYRWDFNYDDPQNQLAVEPMIEVLLCPALSPTRREKWEGDRAVGVADFGPIEVNPFLADLSEIGSSENFDVALPVNGTTRLVDITDGTGNTLLIAEATGRPGLAWSSPAIPISIKLIRGGRTHSGGANVAFCDGSVRFMKATTDLKLLAKLATRAGNESPVDE